VSEPNGSPATPPDAELSLEVHPEEDALVWAVTNTGAAEVRLWAQGNSWGWPMPRLALATEPGIAAPHSLAPAPRLWTRNFPSTVELAPEESARYVMRAGDFDPQTLEAVQDFSDQPLWVQAELRCEPSPEAVEHGVWCGALRGPEQELSPPHAWLRGGPG
jgi:hypothetical protein